jgi:phosphoribosylformylglycinamidine synthase
VIFEAEVRVMLRAEVNDPQGLSIRGALHTLGFEQVESVRAGKLLRLRLRANEQADAEAAVEQMCAQLLANPVIEQYEFALSPVEQTAQP